MESTRASDNLRGLFLALVQSGMYGSAVPAQTLSCLKTLQEDDWNTLQAMARRQTVSGLLYSAVNQLPEDIPVPARVDYALMAGADALESTHHKMTQAVRALTEAFAAGGLVPVYLKGLECSRLYPEPPLRELGDIDIWFPPEQFDAARAFIQDHVHEKVCPGADGGFHIKFHGYDVDVHRQYFDLPRQISGLPEIPSAEAELLMLNAHILKHACSAGVGLRQLCDMALAYARLPYDVQRYRKASEQCGILRWTRMLSSFLNQYLGADAPLFGLPAEDPAPLEKIIRRGGNFGHFEPSRGRALSRKPFLRKLDTLGRLLRSVPFALRYAPGETGFLLRTLLKGNIQSLT